MTPRRSSRARTTQPTAMQHTNSSSSSNSLSRVERSTRSNNKLASPRRSSMHSSQSLDGPDAGALPPTRSRQRGRAGEEDPDETLPLPGDEYDEEEGDEEEITRCICGHQDYPGLPLIYRDSPIAQAIQADNIKDELPQQGAGATDDILPEDPGSLFIQCDQCKVWQHGGCVGIMEEASSPDEYFCEECRKDLHKLHTASDNSKSSRYLPVVGSPSSTSSRASSRDTSRNTRDKKARAAANLLPAKRRSTMNSRDAAYDEEEQLRRAIEESKEETTSVVDEPTTRRGKRSRSDSEANKQATKRQRTSSPSPSSLSKQSQSISQPPSDDESKSKHSDNGAKKPKGVARNQREKEVQPAEKEAEKPAADSTSRRKSRAERRKGEDEEPTEAASPTKAASNPPAATPSAPDTPSASTEPSSTKPATRKTGRPPARRGRLGRNQYTRDRDAANGSDANQTSTNSPRRGQSREAATSNSPPGQSNGIYMNGGGESGKPSKPRYMNPHRTTMNEMKRRVAAILEFISRMQVEMAVSGERTTPPNGSSSSSMEQQLLQIASLVNGDEMPMAMGGDGDQKEKDFKELTSVEMMDVLTRNLLKWQQEYGKFGEK
ncbi:hypothetical protein AJ80_09282 [Polytolypa hystricis UAMH7299]|uniref:Zinc finger PHD-type domain-containing protein n=1 Tax=Polytolypa hystricis (strain UAMH7299) TaxID=1447883 RepID=A0A2B7WTR0_POLH7|nr:hypothetical protein AJ80_09282 [Polytolypa hystricis UAMH7299]